MAGDILSELTPAFLSLDMEQEESDVSRNPVARVDFEDGEWVDSTKSTPSDAAVEAVSEELSRATFSSQKRDDLASGSQLEDYPFEFSFIVSASDTSAVLALKETAVLPQTPIPEDSLTTTPRSEPKHSSSPTGRQKRVHHDPFEDRAGSGSRVSDGYVTRKPREEVELFSLSTDPVALCHAVRETVTETRHRKRRAPGDGHLREATGVAAKHIHVGSPAIKAPSSSQRCIQPPIQVTASAKKELEPMRYVIQGVQRLSPEEIGRECIWATWTLQEAIGSNFPTCIKRIRYLSSDVLYGVYKTF